MAGLAAFVLHGARGACCILGRPRTARPLLLLLPTPHLQLAAPLPTPLLAGRARAQTFASRVRVPPPAARAPPRALPTGTAAARDPAPPAPAPLAGLHQNVLGAVAPLAFHAEDVGGEDMMVATVNQRPFFLTFAEHAGLRSFVEDQNEPRDLPQMLMLTGTIKSGKTRILKSVLPGLLAARLVADPRSRRPVVFLHTFPVGAPVDVAAHDLAGNLVAFSATVGLSLPSPRPPDALNRLPALLQQLTEHVRAEGGELWVLLDELQAPIVASTPADASYFVAKLKLAVELCSPFARIVGTGSGMVSLLSAVRSAAPNGFVLWDSVSHVSLGREPPAPVARAMAERILASHARSHRWPDAFKELLTPQRACDELARSAHGELTSPRPALVAYLAGLVGSGGGVGTRGGGPAIVLKRAVRTLLAKLDDESLRDTVTGLLLLQPSLRMWLRKFAEQGPDTPPVKHLLLKCGNMGEAHLEFAELLCEESEPARLMPPYGALLRRLLTRDGDVAAVFSAGRVTFQKSVQDSLKCFADFDKSPPSSPYHITPATCKAISKAVLESLASNGVGVVEDGLAARPPLTVDEIRGVPAIAEVLAALDTLHDLAQKLSVKRASDSLRKIESASPDKKAAYLATLGVSVLVWLRHFDGHTRFDAGFASRSRLTEAIVTEAVRVAASVLVQAQGAAFEINGEGALQPYKSSAFPTAGRA